MVAGVTVSEGHGLEAIDILQKALTEGAEGRCAGLAQQPGGVLGASVDKPVRSWRGGRVTPKVDTQSRRFEASPGDLLQGAPVVVDNADQPARLKSLPVHFRTGAAPSSWAPEAKNYKPFCPLSARAVKLTARFTPPATFVKQRASCRYRRGAWGESVVNRD